jgi:hypothetical protein
MGDQYYLHPPTVPMGPYTTNLATTPTDIIAPGQSSMVNMYSVIAIMCIAAFMTVKKQSDRQVKFENDN